MEHSPRTTPALPTGAVVTASCAAPPEAVWALLADPVRWPEWAPHIRRVTITRGHEARPPLLAAGQLLVVHGTASVAVRVRITHVDRGRRWDWTVRLPGPWTLQAAHVVEPHRDGSRMLLAQRVDGPAAAIADWPARTAYAPLARTALRRLARLAESG